MNCGDEITADTTLDSDLIDCPNNGIVIGADGVTLDLNGHTIDGDGEPFEPCPEDEPATSGWSTMATTASGSRAAPSLTLISGVRVPSETQPLA